MSGKYLITTDNWFVAPDGKQYNSVWGEVTAFEDNNVLGIKTNARSSNWYLKVGSDNNHVIIAGCQVHYAVKSDEKPTNESVEDYSIVEGVIKTHVRPSRIYITE